MIITHQLHTEITDITTSTAGFDIEVKCQAAFFVNTGDSIVKLYFNDNTTNYYQMEPGAMLTLDINNPGEIIYEKIKVEFDFGRNPVLKIMQQFKTIIQ
jgi:hypothetical protein